MYLVIVVSDTAGVQTGQEPFGLLLHSCGRGHGQQESGQLQSGGLVLLLQDSQETFSINAALSRRHSNRT